MYDVQRAVSADVNADAGPLDENVLSGHGAGGFDEEPAIAYVPCGKIPNYRCGGFGYDDAGAAFRSRDVRENRRSRLNRYANRIDGIERHVRHRQHFAGSIAVDPII